MLGRAHGLLLLRVRVRAGVGIDGHAPPSDVLCGFVVLAHDLIQALCLAHVVEAGHAILHSTVHAILHAILHVILHVAHHGLSIRCVGPHRVGIAIAVHGARGRIGLLRAQEYESP